MMCFCLSILINDQRLTTWQFYMSHFIARSYNYILRTHPVGETLWYSMLICQPRDDLRMCARTIWGKIGNQNDIPCWNRLKIAKILMIGLWAYHRFEAVRYYRELWPLIQMTLTDVGLDRDTSSVIGAFCGAQIECTHLVPQIPKCLRYLVAPLNDIEDTDAIEIGSVSEVHSQWTVSYHSPVVPEII